MGQLTKNFMQQYSGQMPVRKQEIQTALKGNQISKLRKANPLETQMLVVMVINESFALLRHELNVDQIAIYAKRITETYWHLKIEELGLILNNGIEGKYGKMYGNFCYQTLVEWINEYDKEKNEILSHQHQDQKAQLTHGSNLRNVDNQPKQVRVSIDNLRKLIK